MRSLRSFVNILGRFLSGTTTVKEDQLIEKWYSSLDRENNYPKLETEEAKALHRKDFEAIRSRMQKRKRHVPTLALWSTWSAAAALAILGAFIFYFSYKSPTGKTHVIAGKIDLKKILQPDTKFHNHLPHQVEVWLTDSSSVVLQPQSSLSVTTSFNHESRDVILEGEAFFKIKRDESKPFQVFTYGIITKVLGTSFTVKAPSVNEQITVAVKTGKVSVVKDNRVFKKRNTQSPDYVLLTPNQQVTFDPQVELLHTSLVPIPVPLLNNDASIKNYDDERVIKILDDLKQLYGIEIIYNASAMTCRITTTFQNEGLYDRLEIVTRAIGAQYKVDGPRIQILDPTCKILTP